MAAPAQAYSSPHTRSIADLTRQAGAIQADTTARAGEMSGRMWQGIGQNVGGFLSQLGEENWKGPERQRQIEAQKKREALDTQAAELTIAEKKAKGEAVEKEKGIQTQIGVYRSRAMKQNQDGTWALDLSNLRQQMESAGLGDRMDEIEQRYGEIQKDTLAHTMAKKQIAAIEDSAFAKMGRMVQDMGNTPEAFSAAVAHFTQNGMLSDEQVAKYVERAEKDPEAIGQISAGLASLDRKEAPVKEIVPGSLADVVTREEARLGRALTGDETIKLRNQYEKAGWKPERPRGGSGDGADGTLSSAQVATAKRWKLGELTKAEDSAKTDLATATETYNKMLREVVTPNDPTDAAFVRARAFIDQAKKDVYGRLEQKKRQILSDFDDMVGAPYREPTAGTPPPDTGAPAPFKFGYQSPIVENLQPAPQPKSPYAGRVISAEQVRRLAQQFGISFDEAKARAERAYQVTVR